MLFLKHLVEFTGMLSFVFIGVMSFLYLFN
jgi:hypothetical protein